MKTTLVLLSITLLFSCLVNGRETGNDDSKSSKSSKSASTSATNPDCSWGSWGAWDSCSANCDGGYQRRYKSCVCTTNGKNTTSDASQCYTRNNRYQPYEDRSCNQQACCSYSWGNWTACNAPCGGGYQTRSQICECKPRYNTTSTSKNSKNSKNDDDDDSNYYSSCSGSATTQTRVCNNMSCCDWGNWTNWSSCEGSGSSRCGSYNSKQYRYRECSCIPGYDQVTLVPTPAASPTSSSKYGKYKRALNTNKNSKTPQSSPQPSSPPPVSRVEDICKNGEREWEDQPCGEDGCCRWGEWTEVQPCTLLCGGGITVRSKPCICPTNNTDADGNVEYEESDLLECTGLGPQPYSTLPCNTNPCCELTYLCSANPCSDNDTLASERICTCEGLTPEETNSSLCDYIQPEQCEDCDDSCCDYGQWSEWSVCSEPCGGGTQWRQQFCENCNINEVNDCNCTSGRIETQDCNLQQCCNYTSRYTEPTPCNKECGGGLSFQTQICECLIGEGSIPTDVPADYCLYLGPPDVIVTECNNESCCEWGQWSAWGNCSKNCNGGQQKRKRDCSCPDLDPNAIFPNQLCGNETEAVETRVCNNKSCCEYGNWSSWSSCSAQCGGGYQYRYQVCSCVQETNTTTIKIPTPTPTPTKSNGKHKRATSTYDDDNDTYYYYDDEPSTSKNGKKTPASPTPNVNTCYDSQSQRQEQRCNKAACSNKKSSKKYY